MQCRGKTIAILCVKVEALSERKDLMESCAEMGYSIHENACRDI
jgi:hypothetical protein